MTRKYAVRIERRLADMGVYKPYVTEDGPAIMHEAFPLGKVLTFESYPLNARIVPAFNPLYGTVYNVTITDCTLPRIGQDPVVATATLFTSSLERPIADILLHLHPEAYERAKRQERAVINRHQESLCQAI